jgi:hypothetical protein
MATYAELHAAHAAALRELREQERLVADLEAAVLFANPCTVCPEGTICNRTHGICATYTVHKCRCADCQKGWREYKREYLKRNPEQVEKQRVRQEAVAERRRRAKAAS